MTDGAPEPPLTWLVGARGLLGQHVRSALERRGMPWVSPPVPWSRPEEAASALVAAAEELGRSAAWQMLWCAGAGVTGTSAEVFDVEHDMLRVTLEALGRSGGGSVFLASSAGALYAGAQAAPYDESSPVRPISDYGRAKLRAEGTLRTWSEEVGTPVLIGRITNLYGPGQDLDKAQGLVSQLCAAHLARRPSQIWVSLDTLRDYLFAPDAAELVLDGMDRLRVESQVAGASAAAPVVVKILGTQQAITIGAVLAELRRIFRRRPATVIGSSPTSALQARNLSVNSRVWPELDARILTTFPAGVDATLRDLQRRRQSATRARPDPGPAR